MTVGGGTVTLQIWSDDGSCSGVLISDWHVLTAAHCVRRGFCWDAPLSGKMTTSIGPASRWLTPHERPCIHDIAIVELDEPVDLPAAEISAVWPEPGDSYIQHGNTTGIQIGEVRCAVNEYTRGMAVDQWAGSRRSEPGDSGGHVFSSDGRLIGLVSHFSGGLDFHTSPTWHLNWIREQTGLSLPAQPERPEATRCGGCTMLPSGLAADSTVILCLCAGLLLARLCWR